MEVKIILHCHSTYSYDAKLTLRELRELFLEEGIQGVCMTEHVDKMTEEDASAFVKECEALSDSNFLFIPGFEVPYRLPRGEHAHVLMVGCKEFHSNYAPHIAALRPWTKSAAFVVLAHPVRNAFEVDPDLLAELDALEVWNQQYEGKRVPRVRSLRLLEELREQRPDLLAVGGVDFHRREHAGSPAITLDVGELTSLAVLEKLLAGAFRVHSDYTSFYGTMPNAPELVRKHRFDSFLSVMIISIGKTVNKLLAACGMSLPKGLKQLVRRRL